MSKLVSDAAMASLRSVAETGMQTSVDIYPKTLTETLSDTAVGWPTKSATVLGWLRSDPSNRFTIDGGVLEAETPFRLLLPVGTAIDPGDQVEIAGDRYSVVDTNQESTYKVSLRCMIRKLGT